MLLVLDYLYAGRMSGHFTAINASGTLDTGRSDFESEVDVEASMSTPDKRLDVDNDALLLAVYGVIQGFVTDERPEVLSERSSYSQSCRSFLLQRLLEHRQYYRHVI